MKPRPEKEVRLEGWACHGSGPYTAPESAVTTLSGYAYGHPRFEDGARIQTGPVVGFDGRTVWTDNTCYTLGDPHPPYLAWLQQHDIPFDPENPIRWKAKCTPSS